MKLVVLVPSQDYLVNAGARIRYYRLVGPLKEQGVQLSLVDIGLFDVESSDADMLLISKCHDSRAHLVAVAAGRRGIAVGVDLFDDYFSQDDDARMVRFRRWLSQLVPLLSFALASTPAMAEVVRAYRADLPVKVVNDPAAPDDSGIAIASADRIAAKFDEAANDQCLRFAWFGIGDNPHFLVGLHDLAAYSAELAAIARMTGLTVELSLLTNSRALTADRLAMISALPFATRVAEWSEAGEASLLGSSFACFLPVNAQPFSAAKSLNRAVTALAAGCQVLSAGYPLYAPLDSLIYRDAETLASDLTGKKLRVSAERHSELTSALSRWGSADVEAKGLASFLTTVVGRPEALGQIAVLHGASTTLSTHKLAHKHGDLSVSTAYAPSVAGIDAVTRTVAPLRFDLLVRKFLAKRMRHDHARLSPELLGGVDFVNVTDAATTPINGPQIDLAAAPLPVQMAFYEASIDCVRAQLRTGLGVTTTIVSELSHIPFPSSIADRKIP